MSSSEDEIDNVVPVMIVSMCTILSNKIKSCFISARKNKEMASNIDLRNLIFLIVE